MSTARPAGGGAGGGAGAAAGERRVLAIERPHRQLMKLYLLRSLLAGPFLVLVLPALWFRYHTLRYRFDDKGVAMSWGLLFRRQVYLAHARIQDIHLTSGPLQRWLGLADIHVQTAAGSAQAEMVIEGLLEHDLVRDFLYSRMRGGRGAATVPAEDGAAAVEAVLLRDVAAELRRTREAIERLAVRGGP